MNIKIKANCLKEKNWEKLLNGKFILDDLLKTQNDGLIEKNPILMKEIGGFKISLPLYLLDLFQEYLIMLINQKYQF